MVGTFKDILEGSVIIRILFSLNSIYAHSYLRKCFDTLGAAYDNSCVLKVLLGKSEREYYSHSVLFKAFKLKLRFFDYIFKGLSKLYERVKHSSFILATFIDTEEGLKESPLKMLGVLLVGVGFGYLIFRHTLYELIAVTIVILVAIVLILSQTSLRSLLENSRFYQLCKYLFE